MSRSKSAGEEVSTTADGRIETVRIVADGSPVANYRFDVTPARLVSALITERGIIPADGAALAAEFPERSAASAVRARSAAE
jgi:methylthioribose-1-phosphate isomerase